MLANGLPGLLVGGKGQRPLPHFDGFVTKTGLLVQDGQVLDGRKVARVNLYRRFQLAHRVVHAAFLAVQQTQVEMQAIGQRIDADAALEVLDRLVQTTGLVGLDPGVQGRLGLARNVRSLGRRLPCRRQASTAAITSAMRNGFSMK